MDNSELSAIKQELKDQRAMIEQILISVEKTRQYYLWTMWGSIIFFVVPLIGLAFAIPYFMSSYSSYLNGSGLGL